MTYKFMFLIRDQNVTVEVGSDRSCAEMQRVKISSLQPVYIPGEPHIERRGFIFLLLYRLLIGDGGRDGTSNPMNKESS